MGSPPKNHSRAYRIVSPEYPSFDGSGTYRWGSRWISPGRWVVHAAESFALAMLESLVHWQSSALPPALLCVVVDIPDSINQERLDRTRLPPPKARGYSQYRAIGNDWYDRGESVVLWAPSVVSPHESNLLFNQMHADFSRIIIHGGVPARVDPRLFGNKP